MAVAVQVGDGNAVVADVTGAVEPGVLEVEGERRRIGCFLRRYERLHQSAGTRTKLLGQ